MTTRGGRRLTAVAVVVAAGALAHRPLSRVPENTLKYAVGVMLTSFGMFWGAEGAGASWPGQDAAIPALVAFTLVSSLILVRILRHRHARIPAPSRPATGMSRLRAILAFLYDFFVGRRPADPARDRRRARDHGGGRRDGPRRVVDPAAGGDGRPGRVAAAGHAALGRRRHGASPDRLGLPRASHGGSTGPEMLDSRDITRRALSIAVGFSVLTPPR